MKLKFDPRDSAIKDLEKKAGGDRFAFLYAGTAVTNRYSYSVKYDSKKSKIVVEINKSNSCNLSKKTIKRYIKDSLERDKFI